MYGMNVKMQNAELLSISIPFPCSLTPTSAWLCKKSVLQRVVCHL